MNIYFKTSSAAAEYINGDSSTIIKCCKGKYKSTQGHTFRYATFAEYQSGQVTNN